MNINEIRLGSVRALALSTMLILSACGGNDANGIIIHESLKPQRNEIQIAYNDYHNAYGCAPLITALAGAEQGVINNERLLENVKGNTVYYYDSGDIRNITLHALGHACVDQDSIKAFSQDEQFELEPGVKVTGIEGFSLKVTLPDGTQTAFRKIEEGAAEYLAFSLDPKYSVTHPGYFAVGSLTARLARFARIEPKQVAQQLQKSNLKDFIASILRKPVDKVSQQDILRIVDYYDGVYSGRFTVEDVFNDMAARP